MDAARVVMADILRKNAAAGIALNGAIAELAKTGGERERAEVLELLRSQAKDGVVMSVDAARACFLRLQARLRARNEWDRDAEFHSTLTASACARYLRTACLVRALPAYIDPRASQYAERCLEEMLVLVVKCLATLRIVTHTEQHIAALCAPFNTKEHS